MAGGRASIAASVAVTRFSATPAAAGPLLAATILALAGCSTNACMDLCDTWYEYRERVCDDATAVDALARCESDYRSVADDSAEALACAEASALDVLSSDDPRCCDVAGESCVELPLPFP